MGKFRLAGRRFYGVFFRFYGFGCLGKAGLEVRGVDGSWFFNVIGVKFFSFVDFRVERFRVFIRFLGVRVFLVVGVSCGENVDKREKEE